jgi:hypothetical protein
MAYQGMAKNSGARALALQRLRGRQPPASHRSPSADLPLHHGRVPKWLAARMSRLGAVISSGRHAMISRTKWLAQDDWHHMTGTT